MAQKYVESTIFVGSFPVRVAFATRSQYSMSSGRVARKPVTSRSFNETFSFADAMQGVTPLSQDKVEPDKQVELFKKSQQVKGKHLKHSKQLAASFDFSDMYQAALPQEGPMRFCQEGESTHILKQLRRGDYSPEMTLDLHGLTREMAKAELAALIHTARKELIDCVCVMHGFGQGVLKAALPHYLVQHPHVRAFHQAPLEYGGQAALLVLIDIPLQNNKR